MHVFVRLDSLLRTSMLLSLFGALGTACVTAGEGQQIHHQLDILEANQKTDRETAAAERQKNLDETQSRAKQLQDALDSLNKAARKSGADLSVDLGKAQDDLAQIHGDIEVIKHRLDAIEAGDLERDKKIAELMGNPKLKPAPVLDPAEHPTDKAAVYALALKKLDAGEAPRARELLTDFLARFKGDPLSANAQYWLGETWYAEKKYKDALAEFQKVPKEYKGSEKVPDAQLKIGMCFQNLGDCKTAMLFFETVTEEHKSSGAAKMAREKLAECKKK